MAILLTGGTGKTSIRIARMLQGNQIPFVLASRRGPSTAPQGMPATTFNYLDPSTFANPFSQKHDELPDGAKISAIYLVSPEIQEPSPPMIDFVDFAFNQHGVRRFVLLTGSSAEKGGCHVGKLWQHLEDLGAEYTVLRATWFMDNFSEGWHLASIRNEGKIYSACLDGKMPLVSADDIAAMAFHALTAEKPLGKDYRILGPELLTYDHVAAKLTTHLGKPVRHIRVSVDELVQRYLDLGVSEGVARFLPQLDAMTAAGGEERIKNDAVDKITAKAPMSFDAWVQQRKQVWL